MKKAQKALREFEKIEIALDRTAHIVRSTRDEKLWSHEAAVRKRIKALKEPEFREFRNYKKVYEGYLALLDEISARLLYYKRRGTSYKFEDIVKRQGGLHKLRHHFGPRHEHIEGRRRELTGGSRK